MLSSEWPYYEGMNNTANTAALKQMTSRELRAMFWSVPAGSDAANAIDDILVQRLQMAQIR